MEQCRNESVLEFVHRINRHFHGNSSRWYTKTKRECLISGLKQEIAVKLRDDVRDGDPSLTWEQTVDAAEDAESLVYLIKRQQPTRASPKYNYSGQFKVLDEDGYVVVYTDGACSNNGQCNPKAGIRTSFGDNHNL